MKPRGWLVKIHRWLSFTTLIWVLIISITGAWLIFAPTFESWIHPDRYEVTSDEDIGAQAAWDVVQDELTGEQYAYYLTLPVNSRGVYRIDTARPDPSGATYTEEGEEYPVEIYDSYFVDPGTGEVNDVADDGEGFTNWMLRGHIYLWQDNGIAGAFDQQNGWCRSGDDGHEPGGAKGVVCDVLPTGDDMVSWLGVAWIVIILTGFHIWYWPGVKRWSRAVRVQRGRGRFTFHLSLHKVIGFLVWVPLLAIAFTGITFAFGNLGAWYDNVTPAQRDFYLWEAAGGGRTSPRRSTASSRWMPTASSRRWSGSSPTGPSSASTCPRSETGACSTPGSPEASGPVDPGGHRRQRPGADGPLLPRGPLRRDTGGGQRLRPGLGRLRVPGPHRRVPRRPDPAPLVRGLARLDRPRRDRHGHVARPPQQAQEGREASPRRAVGR